MTKSEARIKELEDTLKQIQYQAREAQRNAPQCETISAEWLDEVTTKVI